MHIPVSVLDAWNISLKRVYVDIRTLHFIMGYAVYLNKLDYNTFLGSGLWRDSFNTFPLAMYIVGYTVGNSVLRRRASEAVKRDFRT